MAHKGNPSSNTVKRQRAKYAVYLGYAEAVKLKLHNRGTIKWKIKQSLPTLPQEVKIWDLMLY